MYPVYNIFVRMTNKIINTLNKIRTKTSIACMIFLKSKQLDKF
jgi:hypothetical protein